MREVSVAHRALASPLRRIPARWRDRWIARDPGGFSQRAALRAGLSLTGTGAILLALGDPLGAATLASALAMVTSVAVFDPRRHQQARTMALGLLAAGGSTTLAALVAGSAWAESAVLCGVAFLAVLARAGGPRGTGVGMLAFMGYFFAIFLHVQVAQLPLLLGSLAIAGAVAFFVRFVVAPERPTRVRAQWVRAFRARLQVLLDDLAAELQAPSPRERRLRRIRRETGQLDELALALEQAAGRSRDERPPAEVRPWLLALLRAEVASDLLAEVAHRASAHAERPRLAALVGALQGWIDCGGADARGAVLRRLDEVPRGLEHRQQVERAVQLLVDARPWAEMPPPLPGRLTQMSYRVGGGGTAGVPGWPNVRIAAQATVAVALAIVAGRAISPERWYWAVLAAFTVFIRAATFAETLSRAWQRFVGTVLGVTAALFVAHLLHAHRALASVVALFSMFAAYGLLRISYGGMILFVTIALALLYETMGAPVSGLMELRLVETAAGAAIGVLVAAVVFPVHSEGRVRRLVADVFRQAAPTIERATTPGVDPCTDDALHHDIRRVDLALAEVRNALQPLWTPHVPIEPGRLVGQLRDAAAIAYATRRVLAGPCGPAQGDVRAGRQTAANCRAVARALEEGRPPALVPAGERGGELCAQVDAVVQRVSRRMAGEGRPAAAGNR